MKRLFILVGAILVSTCSFAATQSLNSNKNSFPFKALGAGWNVHQYHPKLDKNDISMVYGGADISRKPTLVTRTAAA